MLKYRACSVLDISSAVSPILFVVSAMQNQQANLKKQKQKEMRHLPIKDKIKYSTRPLMHYAPCSPE
jgi:hypothetical protein